MLIKLHLPCVYCIGYSAALLTRTARRAVTSASGSRSISCPRRLTYSLSGTRCSQLGIVRQYRVRRCVSKYSLCALRRFEEMDLRPNAYIMADSPFEPEWEAQIEKALAELTRRYLELAKKGAPGVSCCNFLSILQNANYKNVFLMSRNSLYPTHTYVWIWIQ